MSISAGFVGLYALLLTLLAIYVSMGRIKYRISLGDGGNDDLQRRRRSHGNAVEHAVIMIPLVMLYEMRNGNIAFLVVISYGFLLLRVFHATSLIASPVSKTRRITSGLSYLAEVVLAVALVLTLLR
ncbi:MAG: MAPEG family protein [Pseudomonadota bacterium]